MEYSFIKFISLQNILLFASFSFISPYLVFDFHIKNPDLGNDTHPNFDSKKLYYTDIEIGTPLQKFNVSLISNKFSYYIVSTQSDDGTFGYNYFNESKSSTCYIDKSIQVIIKNEIDEGYITYDYVKLGNLFQNVSFPLAYSLNYDASNGKNVGYLGLSCSEEDSMYYVYPNFIETLKESNIINSNDFFMEYLDDNNGRIYIGTTPEEVYQNYSNMEFIDTYVGSTKYLFWGFTINKMTLTFGNKKILSINLINVALEIQFEEWLMTGFKELNNTFYQSFFMDKIEKKQCFKTPLGFYDYYYCNEDVNVNEITSLSFFNTKLNMEFNITSKDLFFEYKNKKYFSIRFYQYAQSNVLLVGDSFLRRYKPILNNEKKTIGFYREKIPASNKNNESILNLKPVSVILIILIIICITLIIYMIRYIFKLQNMTPKKKVATELTEEYVQM